MSETPMATTNKLFGGTMMSPIVDPYSVYKRLRDHAPALPVNTMMGIIHMITRYDDVLTVLKDGKTYSSKANARGIGIVMGRTILEMEGKEHVRFRNIISPFFSPRAMKAETADLVGGIVNRLIDDFAGAGAADLVQQFTFTFPMEVMANIIGVPVDDYHAFHRMALDLISVGDDPARGFQAAQDLVAYLSPLMAERKAEPRGDLLSKLVHAEVEGSHLTDEEVLGFLRLLLPAGAETTYRLTGSCLYALLRHPEVYEEVRADRSAIDLLIQETLRWESPVQFVSREATEDLEFSGQHVPAGALLSVTVGSANRDERHFPEPDRFDLHRKNDDHVAFGFGAHFCAGSHLALLEARTALNALLDRLPNLRLDPEPECHVVGLAFRSPNRLPVRFDARH
ncbi:MAG TPA: cytochrome P450 [Candidatus Dormibacteraeota bacterium]|nr:cytochrome P450 [Candidatus Dormibacteraeota bacterium]